ncbi:MAG TPA: CPBP family intramembrane glutamic endopeptidase [Candidatus Binatia bacterium]|nr:CPBP family intramembrane glutamic endopeptidase [Candidatus Binatia bacterium]
MKLPLACAIWALVCLLGAFAGLSRGYGGPAFAVALAAFAALFAAQVGFAAQDVPDLLATSLHSLRALLPLLPFLVYLAYSLGAGIFEWKLAGLALIYAVAPAVLLLAAKGRAKGCWQDYLAALCIWLPIEFHLLPQAFPYPARGLSHPLWGAYAMSAGLIAFLLVRRLDGMGYRIAWGRGWATAVLVNLGWFAVLAILLGQAIGFIRFAPSLERARALPLVALGILLFNAWPEEFLFRGLLQNLLGETLGGERAGLMAASVIFGLAHLNNGGFPNWRYALLAGFAGLAYGSAWRKTRSIFASALVHAGVNTLWFAFFPTVAR